MDIRQLSTENAVQQIINICSTNTTVIVVKKEDIFAGDIYDPVSEGNPIVISSYAGLSMKELKILRAVTSYVVPNVEMFRALLLYGAVSDTQLASHSSERANTINGTKTSVDWASDSSSTLVVFGLIGAHLTDPAKRNGQDIFDSLSLLANSVAESRGKFRALVLLEREDTISETEIPLTKSKLDSEMTVSISEVIRRYKI
ncbi:hypothetical protein V1511DRAFT_486506 [Dipodascopsis uninucleata]